MGDTKRRQVRRRFQLWIATAVMAAGCDDVQATSGGVPLPAAETAKVEPAEKPASQTPAAAQECPDWSKQDLSTLPALPPSKHAELLDEVWRRVLEQYYDPTLGCVDWLDVRARYGKQLAETKDTKEAFAKINSMLGELEQSHFRLFSASAEDVSGPASPALQVRWIEDELVVVSGDLAKGPKPVPPGSRLLSIEGEPVATVIERAKTRASNDAEFPWIVARIAAARLSCPRAGASRSIEIARPGHKDDKEARTVQCVAPKGERVSLGNLSDVPTLVEHRMIEGTKVGYLAFNVWMLPMVAKIRAGLAELRAAGMESLVLDLRGNPGGVGPMAVPVARMLLSKPGSLGVLQMRAFKQEFNVEAGKKPFTGSVALLVDEGTASTSEIFAQGMKELDRVTVVGGRNSAGAALPSLIEELSGGALLQYVVGDYHSPRGTEVEGRGVVPDVLVNETRKAFAAGGDPVLDAAVQHLEEHS